MFSLKGRSETLQLLVFFSRRSTIYAFCVYQFSGIIGLFHYFSIQGCGRQFSEFIFGPEKTGIPGGDAKNDP